MCDPRSRHFSFLDSLHTRHVRIRFHSEDKSFFLASHWLLQKMQATLGLFTLCGNLLLPTSWSHDHSKCKLGRGSLLTGNSSEGSNISFVFRWTTTGWIIGFCCVELRAAGISWLRVTWQTTSLILKTFFSLTRDIRSGKAQARSYLRLVKSISSRRTAHFLMSLLHVQLQNTTPETDASPARDGEFRQLVLTANS